MHTPYLYHCKVITLSNLGFAQDVTMSSSHRHIHPEAEKKALITRLHRIGGQLRAVERMIEEDKDCTEVLNQIIAARKALKSLAEIVIHQHLHHCIKEASDLHNGQKKLRELLTVLERYVD